MTVYLSHVATVAAFLMLSLGIAQTAVADNAIHFDTGQISSSVTGTLTVQQDAHHHTFDADKNQYAIINLSPRQDEHEFANVGVLYMPDGSQDGTKGGIIYQGCLPESGTYKLRVARNLMATHGGKASYRAEVVILPEYASRDLCH